MAWRGVVGVARRSRGRTRCAASYGDGRFVGLLASLSVEDSGFRAVMVVGWTVSTRAGTHGRSGHDSTANGTVKSKPPGTCTCVPRGTLARTAANHSFTLHPRLPAACVFFLTFCYFTPGLRCFSSTTNDELSFTVL